MTTRRTTQSAFHKTTLANGLRVITETLPAVRSVSLGVWIDVGSRNESDIENGVSHLIEHMVFKGTRRRSARQIASSLESLGGSLNGWTSREQTCYTARVLDEYLPEAVDVLADIACNPSMTAHNLSREKTVIIEEIKESLDNPVDKLFDEFARTYWGAHPLGNPIMGSETTIGSMSRRRMLDYYRRNYQAGSVVLAASGAVSHRKLVNLAREKFSFVPGESPKAPDARRAAQRQVDVIRDKGSQTHVCIGYTGVPYGSLDRMPITALATHLGGGMSSVLFQKIREERGLAYSVYTFHDFYRDSGILGTYLATDGRYLSKAMEIIRREVAKVRRNRLSKMRLDQVKAQLKGQIILGMESTYNRMSRIARLELMCGRYVSIRDTLKAIDEVTSSDILRVADRVFDNGNMAVTVLGPVKKDVLKDVV
ncbi:MAG: pitrilysin family protein [candidate division Zixibacteria bacterium]|jgi:predicted Zn-dependent peptidase|nr:pitrilysin family protein [candidate division Zixibacteria bacterium]